MPDYTINGFLESARTDQSAGKFTPSWKRRIAGKFLTSGLIGCLTIVGMLGIHLSEVAAGSKLPTATKQKPKLQSGVRVGDEVKSFYTRAVTGPLMNKSVCYVCRNGRRPVVMILMRKIQPELNPLVKNIDRLVDKNRAQGLRGFGVLIGDDSVKSTSAVQTFAFENKIGIPMTVVGSTAVIAGFQKLPAEASVTVVLYRKQKVVQSWAYRTGSLSAAEVKRITKRIEQFAADE